MEYEKGYNKSDKTYKYEIKTPQLNHIKASDWEYIYEPAEDTFLLLDALENDLKFIHSMKPNIVLEVGSGSGTIITALSHVLPLSHCLAIDINPHACFITKATSHHNNTFVDVIQGDLTSCLKDHSIDMIVFNPPYVVTPSEEINTNDCLTKSWAGGIDGVEVINRFLSKLDNAVSKNSFGYLLLLKENEPANIMNSLTKKQFKCEIIIERKVRSEELCVVKFIKQY